MTKKQLSIVVPIFDEERGIRRFLDEHLGPEIEKLDYKFEVILVDDGSEDRTVEEIRKSRLFKRKETKLVAFSRNFGKEIALSAGIRTATGEAIIMIDADGQHPVEAIPKLIERWEVGAEVVTAIAKKKKTRHKLGSKLFYLMMRAAGYKGFRPDAMDFRLISREVADEFNELTERNRITRGLIDWLGFTQEFVPVKIRGREAGKSTYKRGKLAKLAIDGLASMSRTPLVVFGYIGALITLFSGALGLFILVQQYILGDPLGLDWAGAVAMSVFDAFLIGLVLISQAITALYVSQIHTETKNRPLYVVNKRKSKL